MRKSRLSDEAGPCQCRRRFSSWWHAVSPLAVLVVCVAGFGSQDAPVQDEIRVRQVVVVDEQGVVRARLGAELPDAMIDGRSLDRGQEVAGLMLYDASGAERGGYVTFEPSGNVGLTLDHARQQAALFVAGRDAGTALKLWTGADSIELRSDPDGSRWTIAENGRVLLQEPEVKLGADACAEYRAALERLPREEVLRACRERFSERECQACLEER